MGFNTGTKGVVYFQNNKAYTHPLASKAGLAKLGHCLIW